MNYKFNEDKLIEEFKRYVDKTYDQHYATDKYQATDIIIDSGHGTGFCLGNVIKYAKRYGRKGNSNEWRKDVMKILHYALIQLYIHDQENKNEDVHTINGTDVRTTTPQEWSELYAWMSHYDDGFKEVADTLEENTFSNGYASIDNVTPQEWNRVGHLYGGFRDE